MNYYLRKPYINFLYQENFDRYIVTSEEKRSHKYTKRFLRTILKTTHSNTTKKIIKKLLQEPNKYIDKIFFVSDITYQRHMLFYNSKYKVFSLFLYNPLSCKLERISNDKTIMKKIDYILKHCPKIFININDSF